MTCLLGDDRRGAACHAPLQDLKQLILEKTEGTPFFMEEMVQELVEQGVLVRDAVGARRAVPLPTDLHIPTTVQGVLAARIDRLAPDEKALLQQLAVIGREFPLSLVRQVVAQPEDELYRLLVLAPAQRVSLRTARVSGSRVHLQACPDAGSGLRHGAAGAAQSVARADGAGD